MAAWWKRHDGVQVSFNRLHFLALFTETSQKNGCNAGIKIRPTKEELSSMSPEFDHRWSTYFANVPDKPVMLIVPYARWVHLVLDYSMIWTDICLTLNSGMPGMPRGKYFTLAYTPVCVSFPISKSLFRILTISDRRIPSLWDVFTPPLDLTLMPN